MVGVTTGCPEISDWPLEADGGVIPVGDVSMGVSGPPTLTNVTNAGPGTRVPRLEYNVHAPLVCSQATPAQKSSTEHAEAQASAVTLEALFFRTRSTTASGPGR